MVIHIDAASPLPVFEQMRTQIVRLIASGQLRAGTKLPTIRQLANDLGVARGTVNKVYDALAREGLVATAGRHGTVVLDGTHLTTTAQDLDAAADALAVVTRQLGLDAQVAHDALAAALDRL